jgi:O-antigen ligase
VAKIVSGGTTLIRGYGTFPHPNLLSAFLITSILLCLYLLLTSKERGMQVLYSLALLINTLGLTVTFSRAGFLALAVGLIIFFGYLLWTMSVETKKRILFALAITILSLLLSFIIFKPYLATRATVTDDAALERIFYARIGLKMLSQHPLFGVGIGDSVLHMQQYAPFKLWPWQIQPIHNYFLLAAAELGIPGALIFIWIFWSHLKSLILNLKSQRENLFALSMLSILISFLVAMQFDHYFYTLQQTQMLLWVILGIISSTIKNPQEGD